MHRFLGDHCPCLYLFTTEKEYRSYYKYNWIEIYRAAILSAIPKHTTLFQSWQTASCEACHPKQSPTPFFEQKASCNAVFCDCSAIYCATIAAHPHLGAIENIWHQNKRAAICRFCRAFGVAGRIVIANTQVWTAPYIFSCALLLGLIIVF